jgi:hypothetical protein
VTAVTAAGAHARVFDPSGAPPKKRRAPEKIHRRREPVTVRATASLVAALALGAVGGLAELNDQLPPSLYHPAIAYYDSSKHPPQDPVARLMSDLAADKVQLTFDRDKGYLPSVLRALQVPIESQMAVFSKTSFQEARIEPANPRTIFFNDSVVVAWVRGGFIELAALDPQQGAVFYTLEQHAGEQQAGGQQAGGQQVGAKPSFTRRDDCLQCHRSDLSLGVPGMILRSFYTLPDGRPKLILGGNATDHRSPFEERWGGWYVTGAMEHGRHMGNAMLSDPEHPESMISERTLHVNSLEDRFDTNIYLSAHSDLVALLVFDHQMYMANLITRVGWEVRCALYDKMPNRAFAALLNESAKELVDYLLFIDEAPLPGAVHGTSGFAQKFAAQGPRDSHGRSLRQFDLQTRLLRYPCSYMIYSPAFDGLPAPAKSAIYRRMWQILSGQIHSNAAEAARYARLSLASRQSIVEILRETKPDLPGYFQAANINEHSPEPRP